MWAEMKPDLYDGVNCDKVRPRFEIFYDGDMSADYDNIIEIKAKRLPPGAKITIEVPCCPHCQVESDLCECGFDWEEWRDIEYS